MTTLLALRIFGPLTTPELCKRVGLDRYDAILAAEALVGRELAEHSPGGLWDITEKGRATIDPTLGHRNWRQSVQATCKWPYERWRAS